MANSGVISSLIFNQVDFPYVLERDFGASLRSVGENAYKCYCPFPYHRDSEASFLVDYKDGGWKWYCHGCGEGGTVIQFMMKYHAISWKDSIDLILEKNDIKDDPESVIKSLGSSKNNESGRPDLEKYHMVFSQKCQWILRDHYESSIAKKKVKEFFEKANEAMIINDIDEMYILMLTVCDFYDNIEAYLKEREVVK